MRLPSYLHVNPYGIYYFRVVFPKQVSLKLGKREFKRSLRTAERSVAIKIARIFKIETDNTFQLILNNNMDWIETQEFLNKIAEKILFEFNLQIKSRGPYSIVKTYEEVQAENDAQFFLKLKISDYQYDELDISDSEDILWRKNNGYISSIISIRKIANKIIDENRLDINEEKYEYFCRQVAEMLWALNIQRKKIINNYRKKSSHVWFNEQDENELLGRCFENSDDKNYENKYKNNKNDIATTDNIENNRNSLNKIFDNYIYYSLNTDKSIKNTSVISYKNKFELCCNILRYCMELDVDEEIYIENIKIDHVRQLKFIIERFPKRYDIRFKEFSIKGICNLIMKKGVYNLDSKIEAYLQDKIGIKTIQNYTIPIRNTISYAIDNKIIDNNIFDIFKYKISNKIKIENKGKPFDINDLNRLFNTDIFTLKKFNRNYKFWILVILLYTGARRNEICDLKTSDFIKIDGVYCFKITDSKTIAGLRTIPIHYKLIDIGLVDFINFKIKNNCEYIFDELIENKSNSSRPTTRGNAVSKWFNNSSANDNRNGYLDICNINHNGKRLHSFRNTFINCLKQQGVEIYVIKQIVGHSTNDITNDVYSEPYNIKILKNHIDKLHYQDNKFPWNTNKHYKKIKFPWDQDY